MNIDGNVIGAITAAVTNATRPLYERMDKLTANEQKPLEATENAPQADANAEAKPEVPDFSKLYARLKKQGKYEPKYI